MCLHSVFRVESFCLSGCISAHEETVPSMGKVMELKPEKMWATLEIQYKMGEKQVDADLCYFPAFILPAK